MRIERLSAIRHADFGSSIPLWVELACDTEKTPRSGFVAWIETTVAPGQGRASDRRVIICDGWDGSFHDARYYGGGVIGFGRYPTQAARRCASALAAIEKTDACILRHRLRSLVREGD